MANRNKWATGKSRSYGVCDNCKKEKKLVDDTELSNIFRECGIEGGPKPSEEVSVICIYCLNNMRRYFHKNHLGQKFEAQA